jgi:hypothetical protein
LTGSGKEYGRDLIFIKSIVIIFNIIEDYFSIKYRRMKIRWWIRINLLSIKVDSNYKLLSFSTFLILVLKKYNGVI